MVFQIYINYLKSMEPHMGMMVRDSHAHDAKVYDMGYGRPRIPGDTRLLAFLKVSTEGSELPDAAAIDLVIDEGFEQIGVPKKGFVHEVNTTNGKFELLWRSGFPHDAASAKMALHAVVTKLKVPGIAGRSPGVRPANLFRYGKRAHMTEALKLGRFRINPATFYNDLAGDPARQDDERKRIIEAESSQLATTTSAGLVLISQGVAKFVSARASDYYVLCLSKEYSKAVSDEFSDTDTCLKINDPQKFAERLHAQMRSVLPDYAGFDASVTYGAASDLGVCFSKSSGYAVQAEFRFAWTLEKDSHSPNPLAPLFIDIGSIEDIAELLDLPSP